MSLFFSLQELKTWRKTNDLYSKERQYRLLTELTQNKEHEASKPKTNTEEQNTNQPEKVITSLAGVDEKNHFKDANGNYPIVSNREHDLKVLKKPKTLFLRDHQNESSHLLQVQRQQQFGNCRDANSPIAGSLPTPCAATPTSASLPTTPTTDPFRSMASPISPVAVSPTPSVGSLKQGKFALLRKYRNSVEENLQVTVTDVTVGDVTVAIREGNMPTGFFRECESPSSVSGQSSNGWCSS
ncbi:uncharacterized protein LOC129270358 [Lytechinus pictus]|uniref:uncharacterized protein LOC129270358 n=1 Tax=Lytechinus pictus TaxID=7653 RepID=UPI0030B9B7C0